MQKEAIMRVAAMILAIILATTGATAHELKIATWNIEHLRDGIGGGPNPRDQADFDRLEAYADILDADVIALPPQAEPLTPGCENPIDRWLAPRPGLPTGAHRALPRAAPRQPTRKARRAARGSLPWTPWTSPATSNGPSLRRPSGPNSHRR